MSARRAGFTIAELLVIVVVGTVLILATMQILLKNQRTYTAQSAEIRGNEALRGAIGILTGELREVSPPLGDIILMTADSVRIRAQRSVGIICNDTTRGVASFRAVQVGWFLEVGDSVSVFADNDGDTVTDDDWIVTRITSTDTTTTCYGSPAQQLVFASSAPFAADSVSSGAQVRAFDHITYGLLQRGSQYFVGRREAGGSWTPLVGPVRSNGLSFRYLDDTGAVTATRNAVAQVEVTLRTGGNVVDATGATVADSVTFVVHTRN